MIHRYWTGPNEPEVQQLDGQHIWHDEDLPPEIATWVDARMGQVLDVDAPRHRSNLVRWWLLAHHGGLFLDHDVQLFGPPPEGDWVASARGWACAGLVKLAPGHPLALAMLAHASDHPDSDLPCPQVSGSKVLTAHARRLGVRFEQIPGPGEPSTWCSHEWVTSLQRQGTTT